MDFEGSNQASGSVVERNVIDFLAHRKSATNFIQESSYEVEEKGQDVVKYPRMQPAPGKRSYLCTNCGQPFLDYENLEIHAKDCEKFEVETSSRIIVSIQQFSCQFCSYTFDNINDLEAHIKIQHSSHQRNNNHNEKLKVQKKAEVLSSTHQTNRKQQTPSNNAADLDKNDDGIVTVVLSSVEDIQKGQKLYKCSACTYSNDNTGNLYYHMKSLHPDLSIIKRRAMASKEKSEQSPQKRGRRSRQEATSNFVRERTSGKNMKNVERTESDMDIVNLEQNSPPLHQCSMCYKSFHDKIDLDNHLKSHKGKNMWDYAIPDQAVKNTSQGIISHIVVSSSIQETENQFLVSETCTTVKEKSLKNISFNERDSHHPNRKSGKDGKSIYSDAVYSSDNDCDDDDAVQGSPGVSLNKDGLDTIPTCNPAHREKHNGITVLVNPKLNSNTAVLCDGEKTTEITTTTTPILKRKSARGIDNNDGNNDNESFPSNYHMSKVRDEDCQDLEDSCDLSLDTGNKDHVSENGKANSQENRIQSEELKSKREKVVRVIDIPKIGSHRYKCSACFRTSSTSGNLYDHMRRVHKGFRILLKRDKTSAMNESYKDNEHDNDKTVKVIELPNAGFHRFKCSACDVTSGNIKNLYAHMRRLHKGFSILWNDNAGEDSEKLGVDLSDEMNENAGGTVHVIDIPTGNGSCTHKCSECHYKSKDLSNMKKHMKKMHQGMTIAQRIRKQRRPTIKLHQSQTAKLKNQSGRKLRNNEGDKNGRCGGEKGDKGLSVIDVPSGTGSHKYKCSKCCISYSKLGAINEHMKSVHKGMKFTHAVQMPNGQTITQRKSSRRSASIKSDHEADEPLSNLDVSESSDVNDENENHSQPRNDKNCESVDSSNTVYRIDVSLPEGGRVYKCSACGMVFNNTCNLNKHMKVMHSNMTVILRTQNHKNDLKKKRVGRDVVKSSEIVCALDNSPTKGKKRFKCSKCDISCRDISSLNKHMRIRHKDMKVLKMKGGRECLEMSREDASDENDFETSLSDVDDEDKRRHQEKTRKRSFEYSIICDDNDDMGERESNDREETLPRVKAKTIQRKGITTFKILPTPRKRSFCDISKNTKGKNSPREKLARFMEPSLTSCSDNEQSMVAVNDATIGTDTGPNSLVHEDDIHQADSGSIDNEVYVIDISEPGGRRQYKCSECELKGKCTSAVYRHIRREHPGLTIIKEKSKHIDENSDTVEVVDIAPTEKGHTYKCSKCDATSNVMGKLNKHIREMHNGMRKIPRKRGRKSNPLPEQSDYVDEEDTVEVLDISPTKKGHVFKCSKCDATSDNTSNLNKHIRRMHQGMRILYRKRGRKSVSLRSSEETRDTFTENDTETRMKVDGYENTGNLKGKNRQMKSLWDYSVGNFDNVGDIGECNTNDDEAFVEGEGVYTVKMTSTPIEMFSNDVSKSVEDANHVFHEENENIHQRGFTNSTEPAPIIGIGIERGIKKETFVSDETGEIDSASNPLFNEEDDIQGDGENDGNLVHAIEISLPGERCRKYKCSECELECNNASNMYKHMKRMHPGMKVIQREPSRKSILVGDLINNDDIDDDMPNTVRIVDIAATTGGHRYKCSRCPVICRDSSNMYKHMRRQHPEMRIIPKKRGRKSSRRHGHYVSRTYDDDDDDALKKEENSVKIRGKNFWDYLMPTTTTNENESNATCKVQSDGVTTLKPVTPDEITSLVTIDKVVDVSQTNDGRNELVTAVSEMDIDMEELNNSNNEIITVEIITTNDTSANDTATLVLQKRPAVPNMPRINASISDFDSSGRKRDLNNGRGVREGNSDINYNVADPNTKSEIDDGTVRIIDIPLERGRMQYKCSRCGLVCNTAGNQYKHMRRMHADLTVIKRDRKNKAWYSSLVF